MRIDLDNPDLNMINKMFDIASHSVILIDKIISNNSNLIYQQQSKKNDEVYRNVKHLEYTQEADWYINDTETRQAPANKESVINAINTGKDYLTANGFDYDSQN